MRSDTLFEETYRTVVESDIAIFVRRNLERRNTIDQLPCNAQRFAACCKYDCSRSDPKQPFGNPGGPVRGFERQPRLSHTAGTHERDQTMRLQATANLAYGNFLADERTDLCR